ncbi:MAG: diguanylate cyclase [Candidatus Omnitrophica bacterium]|nr:diguanylate cyclase [Candidatus Omnitrophota bacterium]
MEHANTKEVILVVDDDKILSEHLKAGLLDEAYTVVSANKGSTAIDLAKKQQFNLAILDLVLPDIQGIELMRALNRISPQTNFIILTGYATISSAIEALKVGAYDYIIKPFDFDHLKLVIKRSLEKQHLAARNVELIERLEKEKVKLEIIMDAYKRIGEIFDLEDLADFVTDQAVSIAEAERASLMMIDESTQELVIKGFKGTDQKKMGLRIKIGELVAGWVAREGEALVVRDIDSDPRLRKHLRTGQYRTKSFISLPLKVDNHVIGVMNVTDKLAQMSVFTDEDLRDLSLLAHQTVTQIENIRLCEKLASMAVTDALTGLFNHRYFQEELNLEILRAQRYKHPLSLIMFDIDGFKSYNDHYGHLEGDRVLKQVAAIIRQNVRQVDIICRYGGDEIVVLLPVTNIRGTKVVAGKIRGSVAEIDPPNEETNKIIRVTISGGISTFQEKMSKEELIGAADRALYQAKQEGRNRIIVND